MSGNAEITGGPTAENAKEAEKLKNIANDYFKSTLESASPPKPRAEPRTPVTVLARPSSCAPMTRRPSRSHVRFELTKLLTSFANRRTFFFTTTLTEDQKFRSRRCNFGGECLTWVRWFCSSIELQSIRRTSELAPIGPGPRWKRPWELFSSKRNGRSCSAQTKKSRVV